MLRDRIANVQNGQLPLFLKRRGVIAQLVEKHTQCPDIYLQLGERAMPRYHGELQVSTISFLVPMKFIKAPGIAERFRFLYQSSRRCLVAYTDPASRALGIEALCGC